MINYSDYLSVVRNGRAKVAKEDFIVNYCHGKSVLDIGCIDHDLSVAESLGDNWLHKRICDASTETWGLDILEEESNELNKRGYNIKIGDAQNFELGRKFDVVVCGDIIEHLANLEGFLKSISNHMSMDSKLIISTPNPFNIEQFISILIDANVKVNRQHTVWIDPNVMYELVTRCGYVVDDFKWVHTRFSIGIRNKKWSASFLKKMATFLMRKRGMYQRDYCVVLSKQ